MSNLPAAPHQTQVENRTLHDGPWLQIGYIAVRPASSSPGEIECAARHVLALPLAGVFAKHDGPQRRVLATPGHALFIDAGQPYRLSFPGCIGDRCLALRLTSEGLALALPQAQAGEGFDAATFAPHVPLPAAVMLARSRLFARLRQGGADALDIEEQGLALLGSTLSAARRQPARRGAAGHDSARRLRHVRCTQEAVWTQPARPWSLAELAAQVCVSAGHLAHAFRAETGSTVYGYVVRSRLAKALDAVLDSDAALTTIALDAGFSSHSHFTARFRAHFGITPTALRQVASGTLARELRRNVTAPRPLPA
jgi:AraC-like DNA-binding protein